MGGKTVLFGNVVPLVHVNDNQNINSDSANVTRRKHSKITLNNIHKTSDSIEDWGLNKGIMQHGKINPRIILLVH